MEHTAWIIQQDWENEFWSYDFMVQPEEGDFLWIEDPTGHIVWCGVLDPDREWIRSETHGTVGWIQRGVPLEEWCALWSHRPKYIGTILKQDVPNYTKRYDPEIDKLPQA